jgi:nitrile hydratase beta subunit
VNGAHDLGGMHGFGPVAAEHGEPVFHADWERRAFGLTLAMGAWRRWNLDMSRFAREQMPPAEYLATTYYEHWLFGLERLLVEHGLVSADELADALARASAPDPAADPASPRAPAALQERALPASGVSRALRNPRGARRDDPVPPSFRVGQAVVARNLHPVGHTRVPRYVRGRRGAVAIDHGVFVLPDTHAAGQGEHPQHVYSVRFTARELWGPDASPRDTVHVDLWDDYLEAAP